MKKTTIYEVNQDEFNSLEPVLQANAYELHAYMGELGKFTIDKGSSSVFDRCAEFASFTLPDSEKCYAKIEVRNSDLLRIIDSHFEGSK